MSALLQMSDVSKAYRRGAQTLRVLHETNLEVRAGEIVSVLGMRGQGKTTLLRIAAGMESADAGVVRFEGRDLGVLSDSELSRLLGARIAWAGKNGPGMRMRMLDYVAMPLLVGRARSKSPGAQRLSKRAVYARARDALERVGAQGCAGQEWESISDWERTLVEVAQGIAGDPGLLLVDDLTDALGIRETDELTALLRALTRESPLGVLMSVSDAQAALWSDRIMILSAGRLAQGPQAPDGNVIAFPDLGPHRRGAERGSMS